MKRTLFLLLACVLSLGAAAQTIALRSADKAACVSSDINGLRATFSFASIEAQDVESQRGTFSWLSMPNTVVGGNEGDPQIPVVNELIAVPFGAQPSIRVTGFSTTDYRLSDYSIHTLVPRQPSLRKDLNPDEVPFVYNASAYQTRGLATAPRATVSVDGMMRGIQVGKMSIEPVSYDPVNNILRVFNDIEVEVSFDGADPQATEDMLVKSYSPYFDIVYSQMFNGRAVMDIYSSHPDLYTTPVKMIVITTSTYANNATFQSWVNWKKQKGIYTTVYTTATTGTSASNIKSFIRNKYSTDYPTFVVIVGDTGDVTYSLSSSTTSKVTDLYYSSTSDSDLYPEMYLSRMPVSSTTELANLLNKIMTYEQYTMADPSYLSNVLLIAGYDATWRAKVGIPTINYGTTNYFNTAHGYSNVYKYTTSYTNCYNNLSTGVGFANYTAHGDNTMWYQPQITVSDVSSLTNNDKYFWAMGNCCLAANWGYSGTCFAEALLRAANKGAFGYIGSCPETYWYEDYYFAVGATNTFSSEPSYSATKTGYYDGMFMDDMYNTLNSVPFLGNLAVAYAHANSYTSSVSDTYYWEAYHCLGDGSVMPYHVNPAANNVSHANTLEIGATTFTVSADAGSYVGITVNNEIIGVAQVPSSGTVSVPITAQTSAGTAKVVVTRQQRQPYMQDITIGGGSTPTPTYYTVTATATPTAGGTVSGAGSYESGSTCTLVATPASGYTFTKWTKNDTQVSTNASYSFTVSANASYVAVFTENATPEPEPSGEVTEVTIGSGTSTNAYLPTYSYYNYSLTEQIYTAAEIGQAGTITAVAFKVSNSKSTTRTVDLYLKHTTMTAFSSRTGWETLSSSDKVYSGSVTFNASGWTTITLDTPFEYNGTNNLIIGMDDNTGSYVSSSSNSPKFYVYSTSANRALRIYNDYTNYDPASATSYSGTYVTSNNQVVLTMNGEGGSTPVVNTYTITASASPTAGGTVTGAGTYDEGATVTLRATANSGYEFVKWTKNGTQVSTNATYSFTATANAAYVAVFEEEEVPTPEPSAEVTIGSGTSTNAYLPTYAYYKYSLTEQIFTAAEIGQSGTITAISFKVSNAKSTTRTLAIYLKHTTKTAFTSKKGWEAVSSSYLVYSGSVTFNASGWTTITLDTPFEYNGTNNLLLAVDDNTGSYVSSSSNSPQFYVYSTGANRALRIYSDRTNYNPASPSSYSGTYVTSNNQVMLTMGGNKILGNEEAVTTETKSIVVYPNPVERGLAATIVLPEGMTHAQYEVFSAQGACIVRGQGQGNIELPCNDRMTPGLYIIRVTDAEGNVYYDKLVVR